MQSLNEAYLNMYYDQSDLNESISNFLCNVGLFENQKDVDYFIEELYNRGLVTTFFEDVVDSYLEWGVITEESHFELLETIRHQGMKVGSEILSEDYITEVSLGRILKGAQKAIGGRGFKPLSARSGPLAGLSAKTSAKQGIRVAGSSGKIGPASTRPVMLRGAARTDDISRTQAARVQNKQGIPQPEQSGKYLKMLQSKRAATPSGGASSTPTGRVSSPTSTRSPGGFVKQGWERHDAATKEAGRTAALAGIIASLAAGGGVAKATKAAIGQGLVPNTAGYITRAIKGSPKNLASMSRGGGGRVASSTQANTQIKGLLPSSVAKGPSKPSRMATGQQRAAMAAAGTSGVRPIAGQPTSVKGLLPSSVAKGPSKPSRMATGQQRAAMAAAGTSGIKTNVGQPGKTPPQKTSNGYPSDYTIRAKLTPEEERLGVRIKPSLNRFSTRSGGSGGGTTPAKGSGLGKALVGAGLAGLGIGYAAEKINDRKKNEQTPAYSAPTTVGKYPTTVGKYPTGPVSKKNNETEAQQFDAAFKKARKTQGPGKVFVYKGKKYGTNVSGEAYPNAPY